MNIEKKNISVWIIEDNEAFRSSLASLIGIFAGFNCEQIFGTCESAIEHLKDSSSMPDIILSDIGLPGISGIEGIPRIKAISSNTHIVMLTVHDEHDKVFAAIRAGASGYLLKTANDEEIIESLQQVMNGGAPMNARIARSVLEMFRNLSPEKKEYDLSEREKQVLELLVKGLTKPLIAQETFLSTHTIDFHVRNIYQKLQVHSRQGAVAKAVEERLL